MERLTTRFSNGQAGLIMSKMPRLAPYANAITRLAAYEDTGLEPEEVAEYKSAYIEITTRTYGPLHQKICEWFKAEREGRLIVLPYDPDKMEDVAQEILSRREAEAALGGDGDG